MPASGIVSGSLRDAFTNIRFVRPSMPARHQAATLRLAQPFEQNRSGQRVLASKVSPQRSHTRVVSEGRQAVEQ